jgi:hypothetical protein
MIAALTIWQAQGFTPGPLFLAIYYLRQTWDDLPGPWPVKVALCAICLAIPGPQDELTLIALTRLCRAWRARQERRTA